MKLKTAGLITAVSTLFLTANANANMLFDLYAGATVGVGAATIFSDNKNSTDTSQSLGAVVGIDIPLFRVEAEYDYLNNKDLKLHLGMVNAYFKLPSTIIHPYIGVGVGTTFDGDVANFDNIEIKKAAAYQGMLGLTFDIPVIPFNIDAEARALYAPNIYEIGDIQPDVLHYDLRVKLRYVF